MQLCAVCGTEITDARAGVCPSCGSMVAPAEVPAEPTASDVVTPEPGAVESEPAAVEVEPVAAESEPTPAESEPTAAAAPVPQSDAVPVIEPSGVQTPVSAPAPPTVPTAPVEPTQTIVTGAIAAVHANGPSLQWHPDSLPKAKAPRSRRTFWLIAGGIALAVIAAIVAIMLVVSSLSFTRVEGVVLLRDLSAKPTVGGWQLDNPLVDEVPRGSSVYVNGYTAGEESALFVWSADRPSGATDTASAHPAGETVIGLVDTVTGHELWTRQVTELSADFAPYDTPVVVSPPNSVDIVVSQGDVMVSLARSNGRVVSSSTAHSSVEGLGFPDFAAPASFAPALGGDLLITSTRDGVGTVGRYSSTDLERPLWEVTGSPAERPVVAGDKLFYDGTVYALSTGKAVDWKGDLDWYYQEVGTQLIAIDYSGNERTAHGIDARTGETTWTVKQALPVVIDASGLLVVADQSGGDVRRLDPSNGSIEWRSDVTSTWTGAYTVGGMIMLSDGDNGYTGIDADSGRKQYTSSAADGSLIGFSDSTLFLTLDDRLVAYDAQTGKRLWRVSAPGDEYGFAAWGGAPMAVAAQQSAHSTKPAVLGVGAD
ncbi:PQQ-binding-like beta-propeller repeat protein [Plantibacter sp. Mn2098]